MPSRKPATPTLNVCPECNQERKLEIWANGPLDYVHGNYEVICRRCVVVRQLAHARAMVEQIPTLEAQLAEIDA